MTRFEQRGVHGLVSVIVAIVIVGSRPAFAGEVAPPAGPVGPTMKTLVEVEPRIAINATNTPGDADSLFKITQPGSYYLTGDVTGVTGRHGIEIDPTILTTITVDLNGFVLRGVPGSLDGINGIGRVNVRNGAVQEWGGAGLFVFSGLIEGVHAFFNGTIGIHALIGSPVVRCVAEGNGADGISVGDTCQVSDCVSKSNGGWGLHLDGVCTVRDCLFYANELGGVDTGLSMVRSCLFFSQMGPSISDRGFSTITENQITTGPTGILALGTRSRIERNVVTDCVKGIDVDGTGNLIIGNSCTECTTHYEFPLGILNAVGEILSFPSGGVVTSHNSWANLEY